MKTEITLDKEDIKAFFAYRFSVGADCVDIACSPVFVDAACSPIIQTDPPDVRVVITVDKALTCDDVTRRLLD